MDETARYESIKSTSPVLLLTAIYLFLVIERPWESIRYLHSMPLERIFATVLIAVALFYGKLRIIKSPTNIWIYGLLFLHFALAPSAFNTDYAIDQGIEYAKSILLYMLMLSVVDEDTSLKFIIKAYVFSMFFYISHSLWEYHNGRYISRMGISRMVGVDTTWSDPNSFAASVVLSLPFVYVLICTETSIKIKFIYYIYFSASLLCVILTGSRTAFAATLVLILAWVFIQKGTRKFKLLFISMLGLSLLWVTMPEEKQKRFETLWNPEAGPTNAQASAEGRILGWKASLKMFKQVPFTGVGAGGRNFVDYRVQNNIDEGEPIPLQAHVLYGEVLAEFGVLGAILFTGLIITIIRVSIKVRANMLDYGSSFPAILAGAVLCCLLLLLFFGFGGHNFYRPLWLWISAWAGILANITSNRGDHQNTQNLGLGL